MTLPQKVLDYGRVGMFIGAGDSKNWDNAQWQTAGAFCKKHGVSFVLVKAFDAGNDWDSPLKQIQLELGTVKMIPYGFMGTASGYNYNLDRDLPPALVLCEKYMREFGVVCGDMEGGGWSNRPDLGSLLRNHLQAVPGQFWASVPANPVDANMVTSFREMASVVDVWMPMAYSDYLGKVYREQWSKVISNTNIAPSFDLSNEFGPNDVVKLCGGTTEGQVTFWYEGFATKDPALLDKCIAVLPNVSPTPLEWTKDEIAFWQHFDWFDYTTGIARSWLIRNRAGTYLGPPLRAETLSPDGSHSFQPGTNWSCQWSHVTHLPFFNK